MTLPSCHFVHATGAGGSEPPNPLPYRYCLTDLSSPPPNPLPYRYYLVDLWAQQTNYHDLANAAQHVHDNFLNDTITILQPFQHKTVLIRNYTSMAVHLIPDNLDFVYVDARHDFCGEGADLPACCLCASP